MDEKEAVHTRHLRRTPSNTEDAKIAVALRDIDSIIQASSPSSMRERKESMSRNYALAVIIFLSACSRSGERHRLFAPIVLDERGVDLFATDSIKIEGTRNRLMISIPANLHPDYDLIALVDSTNKNITEITADVRLNNGQVFKFKPYGLPGVPGFPGRVLQLVPDPSAHLSGSVESIRLFSTRPTTIPEVEWQSFDNGV